LADDTLNFHHCFKTERCIRRYVQPMTAKAPSTLWQKAMPQKNLIGAKRIRRKRDGTAHRGATDSEEEDITVSPSP